MLFRMVPSVLLSMVAQISTFWLVEIPQQPIRISQFTGFLSYHGEKKERYRVKEHKKLCWKLMSKMSLHFVGGHHSEKQRVIRWIHTWRHWIPCQSWLGSPSTPWWWLMDLRTFLPGAPHGLDGTLWEPGCGSPPKSPSGREPSGGKASSTHSWKQNMYVLFWTFDIFEIEICKASLEN